MRKRRAASETCESCGGVLVSPQITPDVRVPIGTDYVCLTCGRPYTWAGRPRRLTTQIITTLRYDAIEDEE
jgi:DNA-directed RNA polymerase subunit RPC12/RpoP